MALTILKSSVTLALDLTTNPADKMLGYLATLIGSLTYWEVVQNVTSSPKSLLIRRKSGAPGRLVVFGQQGSTANAASVYGSATANQIYLGGSPTSTANTVPGNWTSAAILSDTDFVKGQQFGTGFISSPSVTDWRLVAYECEEFLVITGSSITSAGTLWAIGGEALLDAAGNPYFIISTPGTAVMGASAPWSTSAPGLAGTSPTANASYAPSSPMCNARISGSTVQLFRHQVMTASSAADILRDNSNNKIWHTPIILSGPSDIPSHGPSYRLRQIANGPQCIRETEYKVSGTFRAFGVGYHSSTFSGAYWVVTGQDV